MSKEAILFHKKLQGKIFVVFEELPTFSSSQWEGVSSKLKDYATGKYCNYSDKYEKKIELENLNNYIINTNVSAIKHCEGRRYFILDLSTKYKCNHKYFDKLRDKCFNNEVGEAFYNYLLSIDTSKFYSQKFPITKAKIEAKIKSLPLTYQFIKDIYILKNQDMKIKRTELYLEFIDYVKIHNKISIHKCDFYKILEDINIKSFKTDGVEKYKITLEELNKIANKNNWLHDSDDRLTELTLQQQLKNKEDELFELQEQINKLKKQIEKDIIYNDNHDIIVEDEKLKKVIKTNNKNVVTKFDELLN